MIFGEITFFQECEDLSESLNKFTCESELDNQNQIQMRSFIEEYEDEKISKEISLLISTMEDSINIHISGSNENLDEEKEELFMIISRGSLGIPLKPRSIKQGSFIYSNPSFTNKSTKPKSSNVLIHRPIPRKKS